MQSKYYKIEDQTDYVMDAESTAILNTNLHALAERKHKRKMNQTIMSMQNEINTLKAEIERLKTHLNLS
jgi:phage I-like protein